MAAKFVNKHGTLRIMQEVTLPQLLIRARGDHRSLREMARICECSPMTLHNIEAGKVALPNRETLQMLSVGYGIPLDTLALAAYGVLFEEVPEGSDDTRHLETAAPADSNDRTWHRQPHTKRATASR